VADASLEGPDTLLPALGAARSPAQTPAGMGIRLVSPTFVGRGDALEVGTEVLRRVAARHPSHLLIGGEAGVGKTRLAREIVDLAHHRGFQSLGGGCIALGTGELPYAPFGEALRGLARRMDRRELAALLAGDASILGRIAPVLADDGAGGPDPGPGLGHEEGLARAGPAARGQLFNALLALLGRLAGSGPFLLVVEDLHWADSATLETLSFLLRSLHEERVGLLLTFRSDELHRRHPLLAWLGELERVPTVERLELGPLAPAETAELIRAIRGPEPPPEQVARIQERSDGNPFFVEELLALDDLAVPARLTPTLRDVLLARVQALDGQSRKMAGVASVAGREVDLELLAEVAGVAPDGLDAPLDGCLEGGILIPVEGSGGPRVAFRHALIQELAYDRLLPGERLGLHRRFAEALAARASAGGPAEAGRWAELAHHWDAARDEPRAFESALRAAEEAEQAGAFAAAHAQYRRALAGWSLVPEAASVAGFDHVDLLARAAQAAWLIGSLSEPQIALLKQAIDEADGQGEALRAGLLRGRLAFALAVAGDPDEGRLVYADAMGRVPPGPPNAGRARMLAGFAQVLMIDARDRESRAAAEAAIKMARVVGDRATEGHALNTLACVMSTAGQGARSVDLIKRSLGIALELGDPDEIGRAYANATEILAEGGHDREARELVWAGLAKLSEIGVADQWGFAIRTHGVVIDLGLGEWGEAAELAAGVPFDALDPGGEIYALPHVVELAVATGDWENASTRLARLGELLRGTESNHQYVGPFACARAELALWRADPRRALETINEDLERLERTSDVRYRLRLLHLGLRACADLAAVARDRGDLDGAAEAARSAGDLQARTEPAAARVEGMDGGLALELAAEGATSRAERTRLAGASDPAAWGEASERWRARGWPYPRAYALWRQAEASLEHGDRPAARAALQEAGEITARLGAGPLLEEITALARRARLPVEPQPRESEFATIPEPQTRAAADEFGLTPRERDVLELVGEGLTNRQIADALYISVHTVGVHVSRILGKLDVSSRTEAAAKAYRLGLVSHEAGAAPAEHR
jgi:DNA-binding CsgD family transcriptional regulator